MDGTDTTRSGGLNLPTLMGQLQALHDNDVEWQLSAVGIQYSQPCWIWKLGSDLHGFSHTGVEASMDIAIRSLVAAACRRFPEKEFASRYSDALRLPNRHD